MEALAGEMGQIKGSEFPAGLRVVVVDDDPVCLRTITQMCKSCSYDGDPPPLPPANTRKAAPSRSRQVRPLTVDCVRSHLFRMCAGGAGAPARQLEPSGRSSQ
jgi:hypothetical protein